MRLCVSYLARGGVALSLRPLSLLGVTRPPAGRPAFVCWACVLPGQHEGARGGGLSPGCVASGVGRSPTPNRSSFWACGRYDYPLAVSAGDAGVGSRHQPHCARSCELALSAAGAA